MPLNNEVVGMSEEMIESGEWVVIGTDETWGEEKFRAGKYCVKERLSIVKLQMGVNVTENRSVAGYYCCEDRDKKGGFVQFHHERSLGRAKRVARDYFRNFVRDKKSLAAKKKRDLLFAKGDKNEVARRKKEELAMMSSKFAKYAFNDIAASSIWANVETNIRARG